MKKIFYAPNYRMMIWDFIGFLFSFLLIFLIAPFETATPIEKYWQPFLVYLGLWFIFSYLFKRYKGRLRHAGYVKASFGILFINALIYGIGYGIAYYYSPNLSTWVLLLVTLTVFFFAETFTGLYFVFLYASDPEDIHITNKREKATVKKEAYQLDDEDFTTIKAAMVKWTGEKAFDFLNEKLDFKSSNTFSIATQDIVNIEQIKTYRYDVIVNTRCLNNIRGINRMFATVNNKLPDNGLFAACFMAKSTRKKIILEKYPKGINWIVYCFYYFLKRLLPKLFLTKRLYYDITKGKNRVLSKTEVFGRLYYCGFEILDEKKIGKYNYFIARRIKDAPNTYKRRYGALISLNRVGKNGKVFKFYKMRTMHPYSEFLQEYIYQTHSLKEGGKFNRDIRVNSTGQFMRKYWIDELPMFINLLKGDMKLVGVRPLSNHYFSLYCKELQEKRIKFKPGLLPPFYADMPKTLDEIQQSELNYLNMCSTKGVFTTDIMYLYKIFVNIVFKRARSQ